MRVVLNLIEYVFILYFIIILFIYFYLFISFIKRVSLAAVNFPYLIIAPGKAFFSN